MLRGYNGLKQEIADSFGKLVKGRGVPEEKLVRNIQRLWNLSGMLTHTKIRGAQPAQAADMSSPLNEPIY